MKKGLPRRSFLNLFERTDLRLFVIIVIVFVVAPLDAQSVAGSDKYPPMTKHGVVPSHGSTLLGVFYLAAGSQPHPTAILLHGLPGYEQNLDLAQALRREGWNVLAVHYRGSWGVSGRFSFLNAAEDADAQVEYVLDKANVQRYRIDPKHIVMIGHSMGGFMAVSAAAHHPEVAAVVLLSAWNIGATRPSESDEAAALASNDNLAPLSGTDGKSLAREEFTHRSELDMVSLAARVAPRPVLVVTAHDNSDQFATPFVNALRLAGDSNVSSKYLDTDHTYSGTRCELARTVLSFLSTGRGVNSTWCKTEK